VVIDIRYVRQQPIPDQSQCDKRAVTMDSQLPNQQQQDDNSPQTRLGRKLREARKGAGYSSHQALASDMNCDRSTVTKIESGKLAPSEKILALWCELCHVDVELYEPMARLARAAEESPVPFWFEDFAGAQRLAHTIRTWHPTIFPGSLQIAGYSRPLYEVMGLDDDRIEELVAARIDLQQIFTRPKQPAMLLCVIDEAVLHRRVGSEEVMRRQLTHIVELGQRKNIGVQVVPAGHGCNAGHGGAFTIASLPSAPDVLLTEAAVRDVTSDDPAELLQAHAIFDRVRLDALNQAQSLEFITELADQTWRSGQ
jgi:transcriptional regulator with XRE-family HTH domain